MGNPFRTESTRQYHARRADALKSARLEQSIREEQTREGRKSVERMPDDRSLFAYLNPDAVPADEASVEKYAAARDLGRRMRVRPPGTLESRVPTMKSREELCQNIFACNVWDAEPLLRDDVSHAKAEESEDDVNRIREMVRAASWMHHPRTDQNIAQSVTEELLDAAEAEQKRRQIKTPKGKQTELAIVDPDIAAFEQAHQALKSLACEDDAEAATVAMEDAVERGWEAFLRSYEATKSSDWPEGKKVWPDRGVRLPKSLEPLVARMTKLRQVRDQLYYQRLYPRLCHIAWEHRK